MLGRECIKHLLRHFRAAEVRPIDPRVLDILFDQQAHMNRDEAYESFPDIALRADALQLRCPDWRL
jgi:hypothetical protein